MVISEDFFKQQQANATENEKEMRLKREVYQVEE